MTASPRSASEQQPHPLRRRFVPTTLLAVLLASGTAFAWFTASGIGNGSAAATTMETVTVAALVAGDIPSSTLYPGGPAADVVLRVTNPNAFSVSVHSITGSGTITADAGHATCTTTGVAFTAPVNPNITLPPGASVVHLPDAATMSTASLSSCQGAAFRIPVTLVVRR